MLQIKKTNSLTIKYNIETMQIKNTQIQQKKSYISSQHTRTSPGLQRIKWKSLRFNQRDRDQTYGPVESKCLGSRSKAVTNIFTFTIL